MGGIPILWDIKEEEAKRQADRIRSEFQVPSLGTMLDITDREQIDKGLEHVLATFGGVNILVNNAAIDHKIEGNSDMSWSRFENYPLESWEREIEVGLTGAFLCSQVIGAYMAENDGGVILNISSDLGVVAPDQRIYRKTDTPEEKQPVKPVPYSVIKHGLIGLTKYLATYWADKNIRVNSLSPGGIHHNQPDDFVESVTNLIPMGRMARPGEYKSAVQFLVSDASSYMTGANLIIDGGRTCW